MENKVHENEAWWQENGSSWEDEVSRRRALQPLYGIQEAVLSHIFSKLPEKSKVLEFGVGFGRHIEYLSEISELDVYGIDQSPTILQSLKDRLAHKPELIENISLIEPRTRLPFPDDFFDFAYTVSVLIHINPSHLEDILKELVRVTKHGIIHFENNFAEHSELKFMDHNGCWQHSIITDYRELGLSCNLLEKAAVDQDIYFTSLSGVWNRKDLENSVMFSRLHLLDRKVRPTIMEFEGEIGWRTKELEERAGNEQKLKGQLSQYQSERVVIQQEIEEKNAAIQAINLEKEANEKLLEKQHHRYHDLLHNFELQREALLNKEHVVNSLTSSVAFLESRLQEIETSLAWRIVSKIRGMHSLYTFAKPARKVLNKIREYRSRQHSANSVEKEYTEDYVLNPLVRDDSKKYIFLTELLNVIPEKSNIAIHHPDWLGVTHSTKELFSHVLPLKELYEPKEIQNIAQIIAKHKPRAIIFSGFAVGYFELAKTLKNIDSSISIKVYWHGNTTHMYEDYSWSRYQEVIQLCNEAIVDSWGFAKESMKILYQNAGFPSYFVKNRVGNNVQDITSKTFEQRDGIKVGIYASGNTWNKNAFTQIAAASLLDDATVSAIPYNNRMERFAQQLKVKFEGSEKQVSREELNEKISLNDINFYVTFSECAPLLPLESLNQGVPCLTGPNHHYFKGSPLEDFLVVAQPDDPVEISKKAKRALENRSTIIEIYNEWKKGNDLVSEISVSSFLEGK